MSTPAEWTGKKVLHLFRGLCDLLELALATGKELASRKGGGQKIFRPSVLKQILFTGIDALPSISIISLFLGSIVITQCITLLPAVGGEEFIGLVIVATIIRELGPLMTAMVVTSRSCSAIAAELGMMGINQETEALECMGISIIRFFVIPRIVGCLISTLCLTLYFDTMAIMGGFYVSRIPMSISLSLYFQRVIDALEFEDIFISVAKSLLFGSLIAFTGVYRGLKVRHYSMEVPQATTGAVIGSLTLCFLLDGFLTAVFYT